MQQPVTAYTGLGAGNTAPWQIKYSGPLVVPDGRWVCGAQFQGQLVPPLREPQ
jgi:hypothetical protein